MNNDEVKGKVGAFKGKIKQAVADVTDDPELYDDGLADEAAGKAQEKFGRVRRKVGNAIKDVGNAIKK
jgi:uncharacterized protein YjbJ (UPF0337 family)